ncbi:unnamed protein product [Lathyrus sativus]|nr:unnamed protein product [Lathyrus sativus]
MNIISINIIGCGSIVKRKRLTCLIQSCNVDICFIQETKLEFMDDYLASSSIWGNSEVEWSVLGSKGVAEGIATLWEKNAIKLNCNFIGEGFLGLNAEWNGKDIFFINVYSPCKVPLKRKLWKELVEVKGIFDRGSWAIGGTLTLFLVGMKGRI